MRCRSVRINDPVVGRTSARGVASGERWKVGRHKFGKNREIQREQQDLVKAKADIPKLTTDPQLQAVIDGLDWQERHIRYQLSGEWYYQFKEPKTASAATSWLGPSLHVDRMFASAHDWFRFWMEDVRLSNMPSDYLLALVEHFQLGHKVEIGNTVDRVHAGYLHRCEYLVTIDWAFFEIMTSARSVMPTRGAPLLIHPASGASLAELERVLAPTNRPRE